MKGAIVCMGQVKWWDKRNVNSVTGQNVCKLVNLVKNVSVDFSQQGQIFKNIEIFKKSQMKHPN